MTGYRALWGAMPVAQRRMVALLGAAILLANIAQPYPSVAPIHHIPTLLLVITAPWLLRRWPLSNRAVAFLLAFWLLHTLGGRYTYSNLPYDAWSVALAGTSISEAFGFTRNHYDRLVHFAFGVTVVPAIVELARRGGRCSLPGAIGLAGAFVLAAGAAYEIFEWLLTLVMAGADADLYNGQQGDPWDAQKDMALAFIGVLCMIPLEILRARRA
ncbi:putative membrane protein [Sphingomonas laterariae]|uniref:Putative membrane protein n=2 Tax=Edaphosphingomonas laterariae TaxID=861865 RepID=A0A239BRU3_9SPHN|nr:putative membrane protein [Sphingomonas laterariae]